MKKKLKKIKEPINEFRSEFRKQLVTLIVSSFGFVAALFWRDAIKSMIETYIPHGETWPAMMISAIIVTVIVVFVTYLITKTLKKEEQ